ncbi:hypothetical protein [Legionella cherrii]|uniref:Ras family n=1 Tax=Legionella cherrii TaxID=28084 RepID=A0A0W0SHE1_9GAMM|nr:hypothetical protein [Legionella cherrii]KTC82609.1 Ras family protein [Legionella cherrii]VEB35271.1 Ras family [Legionella cherrii]
MQKKEELAPIRNFNIFIQGNSDVELSALIARLNQISEDSALNLKKFRFNFVGKPKEIYTNKYRNKQLCMIVCDLDNYNSIEDLKHWMQELERYLNNKVVRIIVAKEGKTPQASANWNLVQNYCKENDIFFAKVNTENDVGMSALFEQTVLLLTNTKYRDMLTTQGICLTELEEGKGFGLVMKLTLLANAKVRLNNKEWDNKERGFFSQTTPPDIVKLRKTLDVSLDTLTPDKILQLYKKYSDQLNEAFKKSKSRDPLVVELYRQLHLVQYLPERKLHQAASTLLQQSPLPPEIIEQIIVSAGGSLNVSERDAMDTFADAQTYELSMGNMKNFCIIMKRILKDMNNQKDNPSIIALRSIEQTFIDERSGVKRQTHNVHQLNSMKNELIQQHKKEIINHYGEGARPIIEKLLKTSLVDHEQFNTLLEDFNETCPPEIPAIYKRNL